ncbi:MAG: hypothetical protein F9K18_12530 [Thermoanaerobaculia bacterium]|nr:MAG: hypothetical protein F9K18_12530 [Thermoanaerobaculia bacterium]
MSDRSNRVFPVVVAAAVLVALAGSVVVRARARMGGAAPDAPAATVPAPKPIDAARLEIPCWSCRDAQDWPVRSRVDLDLIAPLGNGAGNAAVFFRDFAREDGRRRAELEAARAARIDGPEEGWKIYPPDHPLLLEAERWVDQATMRVYPELFALEGWNTRSLDFQLPLELARSWVARGRTRDGEAALEDFRRAVRLGRLLRQEDATILQDLLGLACLRFGLQAVYDEQRERGDLAGALVAAAALGELAPQRLLTAERVTRADVWSFLSMDRKRIDLPTVRLDKLVAMAESEPDRRFRGEATLQLGLVAHLGVGEARERARQVLERLRTGEDERVAALAAWSLAHPPSEEALRDPGTG